ncbi:2-carboxy-1,4-naphthoquinone phytyltransferase, chloroplastic isoform X2 [Olea europaea var. sylvestris]|uniref:2-carboxy-1,4-naphthoquinone phytyltransferase, chloroplastic isoform X2 n=1 Tax=Olea europaea var. sylvestris TaxID=158386 RepID=UPI000C1D8B11|nr:2-carboxy-1,4-naphthoquinone phytyltransferase, chloroplastic isoform X2 [Olea europaea var. sylvestris]
MAAIATFCSTNHGSGIKKLNDYLLNKQSTTRTHPVFSIPDSRQRLLCYNGSNKNTHTRQLKSKPNHMRLGNLLKCRAVNDNVAAEEEKKEDISQATLLWRAVKLPIYSVALVPLTVGSAAAYLQTGVHFARRYFILLASSVLIITWLNLSRTGTLIVACLLLVLGFVGLTWVSVEAGSMHSLLLLASAVICGYIYQCPPFRLSYQGLGEPLCFSAFGPFATTAFYSLQCGTSELTINGTIISASLLVGFTTSLILFCSHFHQIEEDKAVGKISPLVRLGTEAGSKVVKLAVVTIYSLLFVLGLGQIIPFSSVILCALTVPMGNSVVSYVEENHKDKTKIFMAKYYCVRLHTLFGAALAAGMVAARMFARKQLPYAVIL